MRVVLEQATVVLALALFTEVIAFALRVIVVGRRGDQERVGTRVADV